MKLRIALGQVNLVSGDLEGNKKKILSYIAEAEQKKADLIVFPELTITGYGNADRFEQKSFILENKKILTEIARKTTIAAVIGFVDYDLKKTDEAGLFVRYNAAAVIQNKKIIGVSYKQLFPHYRFFDEKRYFTPGESNVIPITIGKRSLNLGVLICEDLWDNDYQRKPIQHLRGADLFVAINGNPYYDGIDERRISVIKEHVRAHKKPFVYVNSVGVADTVKNILSFNGFSMVVDARGCIGCAPFFEEALSVVHVDTKQPSPSVSLPSMQFEEKLFSALVMGVREYFKNVGFTKAVIGLSGGIDSAVSAVIAVEALGRENVLGVTLPGAFSSKKLQEAAKTIARTLGIAHNIISIDAAVNHLLKEHRTEIGDIRKRVTVENYQARVRAVKLMGIANDTDRILLATGNKTELALGYTTLYGDLAGGLSVIGDVNKLQVYALARYINRRKNIIPKETLRAAPSAELHHSQKDPFDYAVVAPLVDDIIINRYTKTELIARFQKKKLEYARHLNLHRFTEIVDDVAERIKHNVHKRGQAPPVIVVSKRAFGFDLRETIIDHWHH